jgi:predicted TIM-barrel fold metal-dependent hydrolase
MKEPSGAATRLPFETPVPIIDPLVNFDATGQGLRVSIPREALRDAESLSFWPSDATAHVFAKDAAWQQRMESFSDLRAWIANLEAWNISRAQTVIPSDAPNEVFDRLAELDGRIFISLRANPHHGMDAVRRIAELADRCPAVRSVSITPCLLYPLIAPDSREYYPIYSKCVEADLTLFINVGFPGPRVPAWTQDPIHLDEVCWFFPDLRIVMRHGGDPWVETCIRMLQRWPNLWYATSGFAPKYYPPPIVDYLNGRGRDKILFCGYWPTLGYDRVFREINELPIRPEVWPRFLSGNAVDAFRLEV